MLAVETVLKVRLAAKREVQSARGVARKYRLSRNTVRRYLRSDEVPPRYQRHQEVKPKPGPFPADLERPLSEASHRHLTCTHTARLGPATALPGDMTDANSESWTRNGRAPASVTLLTVLRCHLCGKTTLAPAPASTRVPSFLGTAT